MAPDHFDLAIVGAGSSGMSAARRAASRGLSTVLFECEEVGGTCVNRGCVPKKLLVTASRQGDAIRGAQPFGWSVAEPSFDWPTLRDAVQRQLRDIGKRQADSLEQAGVTLVRKKVRLAGDGRIVATEGDAEWRATDVVLATGSRPLVPELPGAELALVSDDLFTLDALPERLALVGGGYIAVEFANLMRRFGVEGLDLRVLGPHPRRLRPRDRRPPAGLDEGRRHRDRHRLQGRRHRGARRGPASAAHRRCGEPRGLRRRRARDRARAERRGHRARGRGRGADGEGPDRDRRLLPHERRARLRRRRRRGEAAVDPRSRSRPGARPSPRSSARPSRRRATSTCRPGSTRRPSAARSG